jgi:hypothetical protein
VNTRKAAIIALEALIALALVFAILVTLRVIAWGRELTPNEWFALTIDLQKYEARLDADDRKFLRYMVNVLTIEPSVTPKPEHQRWLLDIKRRMERER